MNKHNLIPVTLRHRSLNSARIGTINARSVRSNLNHIKHTVHHDDIDVLSITETWLKENDVYEAAELCPVGFTLVRSDRKDKIGGGVAILCRDELNPKSVKNSHYESFEHDIVSIHSNADRARVVVIYRPPRLSIPLFMEEFISFLEETALEGPSLMLTGDFNLHWDNSCNAHTIQFKGILEAFGLIQHVKQPTHVKGHIIDLIITRSMDSWTITPPTIGDLISDHHSVVCQASLPVQAKRKRDITYRNLKSIDLNDFKADLRQSLAQDLFSASLDELITIYDNELKSALDKHAPLIERSTNIERREPWCNETILNERRQMRAKERRWIRTRTIEDYQSLHQAKNAFKTLMHDTKTTYYSKIVADNDHDSKSLFKAVNSIMNRTKPNPLPEHTCAEDLATQFCDFFQRKVQTIRSGFSQDTSEDTFAHDGLTVIASPFTCFKEVTEEDITHIIRKAPDKTCELDPMPTSLVKKCITELAPIMTRIVNLSITTSTVPDSYKTAIVRPLLKKAGMERVPKSYRPVSNLSFISKLIERVVSKQVSCHLTESSLHEKLQSAYKPQHSTETALLKVFNDILSNLDKPNHAVLISLLDLSAAYDTVDHGILLQRLERTFGVTGSALQWFRSYLTTRTMKVCVNGKYSPCVTLDVAVPQGSILGSELYTDYTQPLGALIRLLLMLYHLYADDTQLVRPTLLKPVSHQHTAVSELAMGINQIQQWMYNNKLKLNPDKTEFLVICSTRNKHKVDIDALNLGTSTIQQSTVARNLGVWMDSSLSLETHVTKVCQTCYFFITWIKKIRHVLTTEATKSMVQALIISRLDYCNSILMGLPSTLVCKLQRVMNISARLILKTPKDGSITEALADLHWLPMEQRIRFKVLSVTWKALHGKAPSYIRDMLTPYQQTRSLRSGGTNLLKEIPTRTKYGERAFSASAPALWNKLPLELRLIQSESQFRRGLKTHLFRMAYPHTQ